MACKTDVEFFKYLYIDTNRLLLQLKKPSNHLLFRNKYHLIQSTQFKNYTNNDTNLNNPKSAKAPIFIPNIQAIELFLFCTIYSLFKISYREREK